MAEESLKNKTLKGLIWSSVENFSVQGVQFIVALIIARILDPKDYGLVGMLSIFIAVSQSLIDSGFTQALIRKQDRTDRDNSTVFYFNTLLSVFIYAILYIFAPLVADFYKEPELIKLMRVLCLGIVIGSFSIVPRAIFSATLNFKVLAKVSFTAALISGLAGLYMAMSGFGVWTLVYQSLLNTLVISVLVMICSKWYPKIVFSWISFKTMFAFGSKLMLSGLIDTTYNNLFMIVIGKKFSAASLGQYSRADQFVKLPSQNILGILNKVTYPVLCSIQDDSEKLESAYRRILKMSGYVVFPLMALLAGISHPLVAFLIGMKWSFAATLMVPLCFGMMWYPIHALNLSLLQVKGRSDLFLKLEIIKKIIGVTLMCISIPFGVLAMCYATIVSSIISLVVNTYYTGKLINIGFLVQIRDLLPSLLMSMTVFATTYIISIQNIGNILKLVITIPMAGIIVLLLSYLFRFDEVQFIKSLIARNGR